MDLPEHLAIEKSRSYRALPLVLVTDGEWEGGPILREITTAHGLLLFGILRDVMLWLLLPPARRAVAFDDVGGPSRRRRVVPNDLPQELRRPLSILARVRDANDANISDACLAVADWARNTGARETELAFRQAAALAHPTDIGLSLGTARLARDLSHLRRAETWFRRAIKLARLGKDWEAYIRGYLGLGLMFSRAGNGPAAKAVMERALNTARRWRLRPLAGEAHHQIFHPALFTPNEIEGDR